MRLWKITILGVLAVLLLFFWIFFIGFSANRPGSFYNKNHNAIWIGHKWVGEKSADKDVLELVSNLKKHGFDTVFVHSGPLKQNGRIDPETYQYAMAFLEKAREYDDEIQYQAWLGQLRKKIDLQDEDVRQNVANTSMILTEMVGFDGIHFDVEPVWDGDIDFIKTLEKTREVMSEDKVISVALAEFIPQSFIWLTNKIHKFEKYNSEVNYENVGEFADQIVVMTYDTGFKDRWIYEWFVREQTIWVTDLYDEKEVFIGIPTYEEVKESFDPEVENMGSGLQGIIDGLNNSRSEEENFAGVAVYANWETEEDEWEIYRELFYE